jgi:hypothetical protein
MIRVADLTGLTDPHNSQKKPWLIALLAALLGGCAGILTTITFLWLSIPCLG